MNLPQNTQYDTAGLLYSLVKYRYNTTYVFGACDCILEMFSLPMMYS